MNYEKRLGSLAAAAGRLFSPSRTLTPAERSKALLLARQGMKFKRAADLVWRANRGQRSAEDELMRWAMRQKGPDEEALVNMWNKGRRPGLRLGRGRSAAFHADVKRRVHEIRGHIAARGDLL